MLGMVLYGSVSTSLPVEKKANLRSSGCIFYRVGGVELQADVKQTSGFVYSSHPLCSSKHTDFKSLILSTTPARGS